MKARNTKTGEVVDNFGFSKEYGTVSYTDKYGILTVATAASGEWEILDNQEDGFDWSAFRREAAKDILCSVLAGGIAAGAIGFVNEKKSLVASAIGVADELFRQLQEDEK